jgi:hypothetical protein
MEILSNRFTYEVGFYGLLSTPATGLTGEASSLTAMRCHASEVSCLEKTPRKTGFPNLSAVLNPSETCFKSL